MNRKLIRIYYTDTKGTLCSSAWFIKDIEKVIYVQIEQEQENKIISSFGKKPTQLKEIDKNGL